MAAATLSESTPARIGMTALTSAVCCQRARQTVPLGPQDQGHLVQAVHGLLERDRVLGQGQGDGRESSLGQHRAGRRTSRARRVQGTAKTAPMATLTERR